MGQALGFSTNGAGSTGNPLVITVPGTLAIQSNAGQVPAFYNRATALQGATLQVGEAPLGAALVVQVGLATSPPTVLFTLTLAAGSTVISATSSQISAAASIPARTPVTLNITAVGSTFPGQNLTLNLW